jgi:hypothetical protein
LNSHLLDWYLHCISTPFRSEFYSANKQYLGRLPIHVPTEAEREVAANLEGWAEEMERFVAARAELELDFLRYVAEFPLGDTLGRHFDRLPTRDKTVLSPLATRKGQALRAVTVEHGSEGLTFVATVRDPLAGEETTVQLYRARLPEPVAGLVECYLPTQKTGDFPSGKTTTPLDKLRAVKLPQADLERLSRAVAEYRAAQAQAAQLTLQIDALEAQIEAAVCDLYGVSAEEQALVNMEN